MNSGSIYASRKRRKPVQKSVKTPVTEGTKSNPSKRHRDRLNAELERLANLLPFPQDVVAKLDKLSVLRLSVSYLRAKSFFNVTLKSKGNGIHGNCIPSDHGEYLQEGELLLQALSGFVLVITAEGLVFYASSTIQDYLGFHQSDVIHQSVFELIHTEDRAEFRRQLHWALNPMSTSTPECEQPIPGENGLPLPITRYSPEQLPPESSPFLERNFVCRLRCLLDNSSGFLAMNFQGRLKLLYEQNMKGKDGSCIPPQLALFAIATPLQPPSILEIRTKNFIFRTKHKLDFTPMGCDSKGEIVLGYTETELCMRGSGYQFIHAADMMYCAENHVRMMKTGESGMTVFRLLTKENGWTWVQANARLGYKNGKPDYIIATQKPLTKEEGEENLQKRTLQLPFNFATGEALLYEKNCLIHGLMDPTFHKSKENVAKVIAGTSRRPEALDQNSLLGAMLSQDKSIYVSAPSQIQNVSFERTLFNKNEEAEFTDFFPSDWEEILFGEDSSIGKMEGTNCIQSQKSLPAREENIDVSADSIGSELYNTMKSLDIGLEDFDLLSQDETFLRVNWDETGDINNITLNEEILTYVQESLNKLSDCMYSSCMQQKPLNSISSCMLQQQLPMEYLQQQQIPAKPCPHQQQQSQMQLYQQPLHPPSHQYQQPLHPPSHQYQQQRQPPSNQYQQQRQPPSQQYQPQMQPPSQQYQQQMQSLPQQYQQQMQPPSQQSQQQMQSLPQQYQPQMQPPSQQYQQQMQSLPQQYQQQMQPPSQQHQQQMQSLPQQYQQQMQPPSQQSQQQMQLPSQQYQQTQQLQLCQKMKHMNVNGLFTKWSSDNMGITDGQEKQFDFSGLDSPASELQYKPEFNAIPSPCRQDVLLYQQVVSQPSDFIQAEMPIDGFHTQGDAAASALEDYLDYVEQHSKTPDYTAVNPLINLIAPESCYTGAMSMVPCRTENDLSCMKTAQLNSTSSGQQPFLAKIQTGFSDGNINEVYPNTFNNVNYTQLGPQTLHGHIIEHGSCSDQSSSGFM
ncbi:aryl hydrocarbon receptor-like isoform X2 [Stegostoma tigrinum]|uniref:aryl hydrocarbon receptor-like isoform X2 n=1 Tax=Stegostoma tigrinum TaxID=3053191 RepID=UPI00202B22B1|nr:aryl hydrocarbon receptor-like isoform X2 [Stegostoma tigrinum]